MSARSNGDMRNRSYGTQIERSLRMAEELIHHLEARQEQMEEISLVTQSAIIGYQTMHKVQNIPLDFFVCQLKESQESMRATDQIVEGLPEQVLREIEETERRTDRPRIDKARVKKLETFGVDAQEIQRMEEALQVAFQELKERKEKLVKSVALYEDKKKKVLQQITNGVGLLSSFGEKYEEFLQNPSARSELQELSVQGSMSRSGGDNGSRYLFVKKKDPRFIQAFRAIWDPSKGGDSKISLFDAIELLLHKKRRKVGENETESLVEEDLISRCSTKQDDGKRDARSEGPETVTNEDQDCVSLGERSNVSLFASSEAEDPLVYWSCIDSEEEIDSESETIEGAAEHKDSPWVSRSLLVRTESYFAWRKMLRQIEGLITPVRLGIFSLSLEMKDLKELYGQMKKTNEPDGKQSFDDQIEKVKTEIRQCIDAYFVFSEALDLFYRESLACSQYALKVSDQEIDAGTIDTLKGLRFPTQQVKQYSKLVEGFQELTSSLEKTGEAMGEYRKKFSRTLEEALYHLRCYEGKVGYWDWACYSVGLGENHLFNEMQLRRKKHREVDPSLQLEPPVSLGF